MRTKEEWARMIKNICMILVIFLLLGACSGQAAERGKREAPDHKSACQMVYADKKVRAQEVEKFIIENQKMPFQLRKIAILPPWIAFPEVLLYPCQDYFFLTPDG